MTERPRLPRADPGGSTAANASPVARRVAAERGVDLVDVHGSARGGRITKADVLAAAPATARLAAAPAPTGATPTLIKGAPAVLARYMDESRSIPTATSFRTLTVTELEQRRRQLKEAGQRVSFTHLIAYAIARVATDEHAGDGASLRGDRRQAAPDRRRRRATSGSRSTSRRRTAPGR